MKLTMNFNLLKSLTILSTASALLACGGGGSGGSDDASTGTINLAITDAPIDAANSVIVEFTGVELKREGENAVQYDFETAQSIDLMDLQGTDYELLLSNETVPSGNYEWVRLKVNAEEDSVFDSYIELEDSTQHELRIPSGSQSGLKLVSGFTVTAGGVSSFTIDFDLRKSIVVTGSGKYMLKPTLRLMDDTTVGSIEGVVDATLVSTECTDATVEDGAVYLFSGQDATVVDVQGVDGDPLTTALINYDDPDYAYTIGFVAAGDYTIAYTCEADVDDPEAADTLVFVGPTNVTVTADEVSTVNF